MAALPASTKIATYYGASLTMEDKLQMAHGST